MRLVPRITIQLFFALLVGKTISLLTRLLKKGGGSAAPGYYALKIEPNLLSKLIHQIPQNIAITGTNGKTTTSKLLETLITSQKLKILRNHTGSNLERGVVSTLINNSNLFGQIKDIDIGIWELDEAAFNKTIFSIKPQIIIFLNAYRDQLDRYGEVDTIVNNWQKTLNKINWQPHLVINAGDNNTTTLTQTSKFKTTTFSITNHQNFQEKSQKTKLTKLDFKATIIKNYGLKGTQLKVEHPKGRLEIHCSLPGLYNTYNCLAAIATYYNLNLPLDQINYSIQNFSPPFGRIENLSIKNTQSYIMLIKNPAGTNAVLETISSELNPQDSLLIALNDNFADGQDISWIWDAQFENLITTTLFRSATSFPRRREHTAPNKAEKLNITLSGKRAYDLAVRLKYAGFTHQNFKIEPNLNQALASTLKQKPSRLFILPTYTALLELQTLLINLGVKKAYWEQN